jgi:cobalt-zinc-cadmium resistance protein CzcA
MFLSNVRVAVIVAINIPLALLFAFTVLFLRGKSANLLSIGAVDFGIIVDSTVILVESVYRHLASGKHASEPITKRVVRACCEVEKPLFFSTIIMVCALLPLFTMKGPEGQIFGPMADTYAFALGGALLLAMTVSPVLCTLLLTKVKPTRDNFLVRGLQAAYLWQLHIMLRFRWLAVGAFVLILGITGVVAANMGREFMPELEEGNIFVRGVFPMNVSFPEAARRAKDIRELLTKYPEANVIVSAVGRPDDGTDPSGYYNVELNIPLKPSKSWPVPPGHSRPRTKDELVEEMNRDLVTAFPGVDWDFSQIIRDNVMEALSGVKGENSVKIFGPDLAVLEELADKTKKELTKTQGVVNPGVVRIAGQANLEFAVDREKCAKWKVTADDVLTVLEMAVGGSALTSMTEGEKNFDITLRWPFALRSDEQKILQIPVEVSGNQIKPLAGFTLAATATTGASQGLATIGTMLPPPALIGSVYNATNLPNEVPRVPLKELVSSVVQPEKGSQQQFLRPGASVIMREQGQRFIAAKFSVRGRDLASTVAEAQSRVDPLMPPGYRSEWSGEFGEMEEAESRRCWTRSRFSPTSWRFRSAASSPCKSRA